MERPVNSGVRRPNVFRSVMPFTSYNFTSRRRYLMVAMIVLTKIIGDEPLATQATQLSNDPTRVQYHSSPRVRVVPAIVFARYGKRALRLDLYLPVDSKEAVPGVIVIRGGGWMVNDRKSLPTWRLLSPSEAWPPPALNTERRMKLLFPVPCRT